MTGVTGLIVGVWQKTDAINRDSDDASSPRRESKKVKVVAASDRFVDLFRRAADKKRQEEDQS